MLTGGLEVIWGDTKQMTHLFFGGGVRNKNRAFPLHMKILSGSYNFRNFHFPLRQLRHFQSVPQVARERSIEIISKISSFVAIMWRNVFQLTALQIFD